MCEHHYVTHIVDFTPGSAALAVAAAGTMQYEGIATNDEHKAWMDSILDRCIMYLVGEKKELGEKLGGDPALAAMVHQFFAGSMTEARRYMQPVEEPPIASDSSDEDI